MTVLCSRHHTVQEGALSHGYYYGYQSIKREPVARTAMQGGRILMSESCVLQGIIVREFLDVELLGPLYCGCLIVWLPKVTFAASLRSKLPKTPAGSGASSHCCKTCGALLPEKGGLVLHATQLLIAIKIRGRERGSHRIETACAVFMEA
jgi:hypothetical protein